MNKHYTFEILFLLLVIALSLVGFANLYVGENAKANGFHHLHVVTSLGWLMLLLTQLTLIRRQSFRHHRALGTAVFVAAPLLVASLTLLCVHSAAKAAVLGRADDMVVQNVMVTLEVALLVLLAFALRKNRQVHGALLMSTALLFMGIALFFTMIGFVPQYRIEGPETFHRFGDAAQAAAYVVGAVGLLLFLKGPRTGWPWLLAGAFFFLNGFLQMVAAGSASAMELTALVASIGYAAGFVLGLLTFAALLWVAWRAGAAARPQREAVGAHG